MTLGCGGFGGNITSDNISPKHLLNIKRLAYETKPFTANRPSAQSQATVARAENVQALPQAPTKPAPEPIPADTLTRRIDQFLASRGIGANVAPVSEPPAPATTPATSTAPAQFVCEEDVRNAVKRGEKIFVGERTIITPAARDAGETAKVFVWQTWPS
jgi:hypothetical protein